MTRAPGEDARDSQADEVAEPDADHAEEPSDVDAAEPDVDDATIVASRRQAGAGDDATRLSARRGGKPGDAADDGSVDRGSVPGAAGSSAEPAEAPEVTEDRTVLSRVRRADAGATQVSPDARPHRQGERPSVPPEHIATHTWTGTFGSPDAPYPPREKLAPPPPDDDEPGSPARPAIHVLSPAEVTRRRDASRRRRLAIAVIAIVATSLVVAGALVGAGLLLSGL
ncbi:hypothetical protein [uncultured Demequina sp.]|uniref:hypothetical protein n=1 Tax=uncultured Demequina sp. TaxID=693499 RepID=UPI0025E21A16|nr:hypothetical protein [uncultured Demequina sp.]